MISCAAVAFRLSAPIPVRIVLPLTTPLDVSTRISPVMDSTPSQIPSSNRASSLSTVPTLKDNGLYSMLSPNSATGLMGLPPWSLLVAVFLSLPSPQLLYSYAACSTCHVNRGLLRQILMFILHSSASLRVLTWSSLSLTAFSTTPLDCDSPTGEFLRMISELLAALTHSCSAIIAGS